MSNKTKRNNFNRGGGEEMKIKKVFNYSCLFLIVLALTLGFSTQAYAVHKGAGGLDCSGCHTMHNSQNGASMEGSPTGRLLRGTSTAALCLSCHDTGGSQYGSYSGTVPAVKNVAADPAAGDFADLDATNDTTTNYGKGKGHNESIGGAVTPPGGTAFTGFNCANCHDPHGVGGSDANNISAFRNLRRTPTGASATAPYIRALPVEGTLASSVYAETAYSYGTAGTGLSNFSEWCATCHTNFFGDANTSASGPYTRHPTGNTTTAHNLSAVDYTNYSGVGEGSRFPAEDTIASGTANSSNGTNKAAGNESTDGIFCLSCHKAHATANADGLRWDYAAASQTTPGSGCQQCHNK